MGNNKKKPFKKKIIFLEWPKFTKEISQFDPLNISIEMINSEDKKLSKLRKISLHGSQKWYSRFNKTMTLIK